VPDTAMTLRPLLVFDFHIFDLNLFNQKSKSFFALAMMRLDFDFVVVFDGTQMTLMLKQR
jgi:hypothetical protein